MCVQVMGRVRFFIKILFCEYFGTSSFRGKSGYSYAQMLLMNSKLNVTFQQSE